MSLAHDLPEALERAWQRSDRLFDLVREEALLTRPIALRQPLLFYVGHLPAFAWNHLWRAALREPSRTPALDALFERGIDPPDDADGAPHDAAASWPPLADVWAYRDGVRAALRPTLCDARLAPLLPMVLEHELMHQETLLYMLHELPSEAKQGVPAPAAPGPAPGRARVAIPDGRARLGAPRDGRFRWDNEFTQHDVDVPGFEIDDLPVTNASYREFVDDGGYARSALWSASAWRWLERGRRRAPHGWRPVDGGWRVRTLGGDVPFEQAAAWPVCVALCEARAFARWSGARLPSEAEFHRAAFATPDGDWREHPWGQAQTRAEHANLGLAHWSPTPVGAHPSGASAFGVHELVGNAWEWTDTPFRPYPGFRPLERYPGYSADFFDERHFVLLGASWATDPRLVRRSFRNWFQPHYPYVFAKFRCVRDPA